MHYDHEMGKHVSDARPKVLRIRKHKKTKNPLPENWEDLRRQVKERDQVCCDCAGPSIGAHHIDFNRTHNDLSNLVWLCWPCHKIRHWQHHTLRY